MTPETLSAALRTIGWTTPQLARMIDRDVGVVRRMVGLKEPPRRIPGNLHRWLEKIADFHEKNPLPEDWDSDGET